MPWRGPQEEGEYPTLGWLIIKWIEDLCLPVPAGHPDLIGKPLQLTNSQMHYFLQFYRLDPDTGQFYYPARGQDVGPKGCGKSPEGGLTCLAEFDGPVVFAGWDARGEPVGANREDSVVSIVGRAEVQTGNMYDWLYTALANSRAADDHGWNVELGRITKQKGGYGVIETATSSVSTTGRSRHFVAKEETWLWNKSSGMVAQSALLNADVYKVGGRTCEYTNPPQLGDGTVAELTIRNAAKARRPIMIFRRGADMPKEFEGGKGLKKAANEPRVREMIRIAYGDALTSRGGWIDEDDAYDAILDEETSEEEATRLWLGAATKGVGKLVDPARYDDLLDLERTIQPGAMVVLSFDGSMTTDCTALTMTSIEAIPHQVLLKLWKRPPGPAGDEYTVPRHEVTDLVMKTFREQNVMMLVADYAGKWESTIDDWADTWGEIKRSEIGSYGKGLVFPIWWNNNYVDVDKIVRKYASLLAGDGIPWTHEDDEDLRMQVCAMVAAKRRNIYQFVETEDETPEKMIDAGVTSMMGVWAALKMFVLYGDGAPSDEDGLSTWDRLNGKGAQKALEPAGATRSSPDDQTVIGAAKRLRDLI